MLLSKDYRIRNRALLALGNLVLDGTNNFSICFSNFAAVDVCTYMSQNEKLDLIIAVGVKAETFHEKYNVARLLANLCINEPNRRIIIKSNGLQLMLSYLLAKDKELNRQALRCIKNIAALDDAKIMLVEEETITMLLTIYPEKVGLIQRQLAEILGLLACHRKFIFCSKF